MKKFSLVVASLVAGTALSLNAAVVATAGGKNITDTQVDEFFAPMLRGQSINNLPADQKKAFIQQYIVQDLILNEAKKDGLEKDATYKKELDRAKDAILVAVYQDKIMQDIKIDSAKVKSIYDQNKDKYVKPARVQAKHILVQNQTDAEKIIDELKNLKGDALDKKFSEIARAKSIDNGSAAQGGELGWFDESTMVKPFTDAAFALKKGEISKSPVKTNFGYHIILKENSEARTQLTFDQVKQGIEAALRAEEFKQVIAKKAQELLDKAKVTYK
ncbi:peptidylprolyl isomerase [Campylobacter sp. US33a]|uniref:peptidylprolyl isomerase n=1 Tax=Campylobacter sp. CCS1377 TaxID=3158229 RepID=A0AAU7E9C1_9BACT|nr:peptidylprolyl isomerase [Campylobacter sp. US33a]TEY02410.1 peptidylprolyl isomerase [Campylobacter sp. US33a]